MTSRGSQVRSLSRPPSLLNTRSLVALWRQRVSESAAGTCRRLSPSRRRNRIPRGTGGFHDQNSRVFGDCAACLFGAPRIRTNIRPSIVSAACRGDPEFARARRNGRPAGESLRIRRLPSCGRGAASTSVRGGAAKRNRSIRERRIKRLYPAGPANRRTNRFGWIPPTISIAVTSSVDTSGSMSGFCSARRAIIRSATVSRHQFRSDPSPVIAASARPATRSLRTRTWSVRPSAAAFR